MTDGQTDRNPVSLSRVGTMTRDKNELWCGMLPLQLKFWQVDAPRQSVVRVMSVHTRVVAPSSASNRWWWIAAAKLWRGRHYTLSTTQSAPSTMALMAFSDSALVDRCFFVRVSNIWCHRRIPTRLQDDGELFREYNVPLQNHWIERIDPPP